MESQRWSPNPMHTFDWGHFIRTTRPVGRSFPTVTLKVFLGLSSHFWHLCCHQYSKALLVQSSFKFFFPRSKIRRSSLATFPERFFSCHEGVSLPPVQTVHSSLAWQFLSLFWLLLRCCLTNPRSKFRRNRRDILEKPVFPATKVCLHLLCKQFIPAWLGNFWASLDCFCGVV